MLRFIFFTLIFFIGCVSQQNNKTTNSNVAKVESSPRFEEFDISKALSNNAPQSPIVLQPHQAFPIQYLLEHPEQKGLLVNHYLGTGKTYLALGYAEKNPDKNIVILIPKFLLSNWKIQMKLFGIKENDARYEIVFFEDAPQKLFSRDLSKTILIIDEAHKFIQLTKSPVYTTSSVYSAGYFKIRSAYKILALTGTPIYGSESDLAFLLNLVSGKDIFPYNEKIFHSEHTRIIPGRSLWRGHLTESLFINAAVPVMLTFAAVAVTPINLLWLPILASPAFSFIIPGINSVASVKDSYPLRSFDFGEMSRVANKYVSFYQLPVTNQEDYPTKKRHLESVVYDVPQMNFFLKYVDMRLNGGELKRIIDEDFDKVSDEYLKINSFEIQKRFQTTIGYGRSIGNFSDKYHHAAKFVKIVEKIKKSTGPVVVYSNYYRNGLHLFAQYLENNDMSFTILHADLPLEKQVEIINNYNKGKIDILLLHPEFTEGVSLNGTAQLHVLEPMLTSPMLEQIEGRVVRFRSHVRLPPQKRHVDVFVWEAKVGGFSHYLQKKENWQQNYSEFSDYSQFGAGVVQVDENALKKKSSPDEVVYTKFYELNKFINSANDLFKNYSIETQR